MNDYLLLFPDEATAISTMSHLSIDNNPEHGISTDVIGTVYDVTESDSKDADGLPIYINTAKPGYHINIRSVIEIDWPSEYLVNPKKRIRMWM